MDKETRQILFNQTSIMRFLRFGFPMFRTDAILSLGISNRLQETSELLDPKENNRDKKIQEALKK